MKEIVFESKLLSDGHLYCPKELAKKKNARFKVFAYIEETEDLVTEQEIELAAVQDLSEDFLSENELNYYLNLDDVNRVISNVKLYWISKH